jgi:hypothetical protein
MDPYFESSTVPGKAIKVVFSLVVIAIEALEVVQRCFCMVI